MPNAFIKYFLRAANASFPIPGFLSRFLSVDRNYLRLKMLAILIRDRSFKEKDSEHQKIKAYLQPIYHTHANALIVCLYHKE